MVTTKVRNLPDLLVCRWRTTYHWKTLDLQSRKSHNYGSPKLGVLRQNDIWVQALWSSIENIIRGKVVASSNSKPWWVLWVHVCPWLIRAPKCSNYALTNLFGLCKSVWIIDVLFTRPNPHPETLARPTTPEVLRGKECTPTPHPFIVITLNS